MAAFIISTHFSRTSMGLFRELHSGSFFRVYHLAFSLIARTVSRLVYWLRSGW